MHNVLFLTERSPRHQHSALESAPPELHVTMLRQPPIAKQAPKRTTELHQHLADTEFLISERAGVIDAEMMAAAPNLRLIQRLGSLIYDIDLDAARAAGVVVCAMPVLGSILVAEHMIMQSLALVKRLRAVSATAVAADDGGQTQRTDENTFAYNWSQQRNVGGLYGATIGILGFGEIGAELARRLRPFQPQRVLYNKRTPLPVSAERELGLSHVSKDDLYSQSDVLCNLLPYYPQTDHLLNAAALHQMKAGAMLVSCGSGRVIDEEALAAAIRSGHLGGAALDTFEWEPLPPDNPLVPLARDPQMNVLLTPHTAAGTPPYTPASRAGDYENIQRLLAGQPLLNRIV